MKNSVKFKLNDAYSGFCSSRYRGVKVLADTLIFTILHNNTPILKISKFKAQSTKPSDQSRRASKINSKIQKQNSIISRGGQHARTRTNRRPAKAHSDGARRRPSPRREH